MVAVLLHSRHHVLSYPCCSLLVLRLFLSLLLLVLSSLQLLEFLCVFSHLLKPSSSVIFVDLLLSSVLALEGGVIWFEVAVLILFDDGSESILEVLLKDF